jgi:phosphate transport system substrate-binding protein
LWAATLANIAALQIDLSQGPTIIPFRELTSFLEKALFSGDYKADVKQQPGSESVVQEVASDSYAIGYSGIGYKTDGVRTVPLALYLGGTCYDTSAEATLSGNYPFARYLRIHGRR